MTLILDSSKDSSLIIRYTLRRWVYKLFMTCGLWPVACGWLVTTQINGAKNYCVPMNKIERSPTTKLILSRTIKRRHLLYRYDYIKSIEKMLKHVNDVLGLVPMNPFVKVSIVSILRIYFKKHKHHNLTQRRYQHSQIQGRVYVFIIFAKP